MGNREIERLATCVAGRCGAGQLAGSYGDEFADRLGSLTVNGIDEPGGRRGSAPVTASGWPFPARLAWSATIGAGGAIAGRCLAGGRCRSTARVQGGQSYAEPAKEMSRRPSTDAGDVPYGDPTGHQPAIGTSLRQACCTREPPEPSAGQRMGAAPDRCLDGRALDASR